VADQVVPVVWRVVTVCSVEKISVFEYFSTWNAVLEITAVIWTVQGFET